MSCTLPTPPNIPANSNINLILKNSIGSSSEDEIVDSVGGEISIVLALRYPEFIDSLKFNVINGADGTVDYDSTIDYMSSKYIDTIQLKYVIRSSGNKKIAVTAFIQENRIVIDSALCRVLGAAQLLANSVPILEITRPISSLVAGELCTLSARIEDKDSNQIHTIKVIHKGQITTVFQNPYEHIERIPVETFGKDTFTFIATDNGLPNYSDTEVVILEIINKIPDAAAHLHIQSRDTNTITLAWGGSSRAESYKIYRTDSVTSRFVAIKDSFTTTTFVDSFNGVKQQYYVLARNKAGLSEPSNTVSSDDSVNTSPVWNDKDTLHVVLAQDSAFVLALADMCADSQGDTISFTILPNSLAGDTLEGTIYSYNPHSISGVFVVSIVARDPFGLSDTLRIKITITNSVIDQQSPVINFLNITSDSTVVFKSSTVLILKLMDESGIALLKCTSDTKTYDIVKTDSNVYACQINNLTHGEYTKITIVATDGASPANTTTASVYFTYNRPLNDTIVPAFKRLLPLTDSVVTNTDTFSIKIVCNDLSGIQTITCTSLSKSFQITRLDDSIYTTRIYGFNKGVYTPVIISATDASDNHNTAVLTTYISYDPTMTDREGPGVVLQSPAKDSSVVSTSSLTVGLSCTDQSGVATVKCFLGTKEQPVTKGTSGNYLVDVTGLEKDTNSLTVIATDSSTAANTTERVITIFYDPTMSDLTNPTVALKYPLKDSSKISVPSITVEIFCNDQSGIASVILSFGSQVLSLTRKTDSNYAVDVTGLAIGVNTLTFTATDSSTHKNITTKKYVIIYDPTMNDTVAPIMTLKSPEKNRARILDDSVVVQIECTDTNGIASVMCTHSGKLVTVTKNGSLYSAVIKKLTLGGIDTITFVATDTSTNRNSRKFDLEVQYNTPVGVIALEEPVNKASGVGYTPVFTWAGGVDPDGEGVTFLLNYGISDSVLSSGAIVTGHTAKISDTLDANTVYYWQVVAISTSSTFKDTIKSIVNSFTTQGTAPGISSQPVPGAVNEGGTLTLSVVATGMPLPKYQWYQDSVMIIGATGSKYSKNGVVQSDEGRYFVVVDNGVGTIRSDTVIISVTLKPRITVQPQAKSIVEGNSVDFSVTATGTAPLLYQWRQGDVSILGANSSSFQINTVALTSGGVYTCLVSNSAGCDTSGTATLSVTPLYTVTFDDQDATVKVDPSSRRIESGKPVGTLPTALQKNCSVFSGWYTAVDGGGIKFDTSTIITDNVTVYALWNHVERSVQPTGLAATPVSICKGTSTTLSIEGGTLGYGAVWEWYKGNTQSKHNDTIKSITVTLDTTTTFYVRAKSACDSTPFDSVTAIVVPDAEKIELSSSEVYNGPCDPYINDGCTSYMCYITASVRSAWYTIMYSINNQGYVQYTTPLYVGELNDYEGNWFTTDTFKFYAVNNDKKCQTDVVETTTNNFW